MSPAGPDAIPLSMIRLVQRIARPFALQTCLLLALFLGISTAQAQPLDLTAYRGRIVYLDFWASWCAPCRLSFPWMNQLQQLYGSQGLVVIAVNVDRDRAKADDFLRETPAGFKVVYDPSGQIAGKFDIKAMPTSLLIGRDGKIHFVHSGFFPEKRDEYFAHIAELLRSAQ